MQTGSIYHNLLQTKKDKGGGLFLLIDPASVSEEQYLSLAEMAFEAGVDAILVGTSFSLDTDFASAVRKIKNITTLPVVIFPGSFAHITPEADAILFTSLISGHNPDYLIGEQVKGAPLLKKFDLEAIPTGYMLVESGTLTSVQYISGTLPIPRTKNDIASAHALAAQYMGMKLVYLEAGSGAALPVTEEMIRKVSDYIDIPLIVGGGIRTPEDCRSRIDAGASFIVVGNVLENKDNYNLLNELAEATHPGVSVKV